MDTRTEIKQVSMIVKTLMEQDERCRNDDKWLTWRVMKVFSPRFYIPFEDFAKIPAFETVKRCRAKIQNNEGLLQPTDPKVIERRKRRKVIFCNEM